MTDRTPVSSYRLPRRVLLSCGLRSSVALATGGLGIVGLGACHASSTFGGNDNDLLQTALDRGGTIHLDRSYVVTRTLYVSGDTQIIGNGSARIVWQGPPDRSILCDTSVRDPARVNRNILIQDLEINGGDVETGHPAQLGIEFYRTGQVVLRNLIVHGVGGSGIRWGNSQTDTTDILVERCTVYDCRMGDALQGSGRRIIIRNNIIGKAESSSSFGDSGIALLMDFDVRTNPRKVYSAGVEITNNHIVGNHTRARFTGIGGRTQTGIAIGPFAIDADADITIAGNRVLGCYVNAWLAVMRGVRIIDNDFHPHYSGLSGNVRLDSIVRLEMRRNRVTLGRQAEGPDYAAILLQAIRSTYGASTFDGDIQDFVLDHNVIQSSYPACGIRITFGASHHHPNYVATVRDGTITNNKFTGLEDPIILAPSSGETPQSCCKITVTKNLVSSTTLSFITLLGKKNQYRELKVFSNVLPLQTAIMSGTGSIIE